MTKQEFDEYVQAQGADILRFCRMTTASKIEGDELYQDTMLKLLEQLQHLSIDKNLKSYTLSVAIFLWKNQRRKYARRKRLASIENYEAQDESGNLKVISANTKTPREVTTITYTIPHFAGRKRTGLWVSTVQGFLPFYMAARC